MLGVHDKLSAARVRDSSLTDTFLADKSRSGQHLQLYQIYKGYTRHRLGVDVYKICKIYTRKIHRCGVDVGVRRFWYH